MKWIGLLSLILLTSCAHKPAQQGPWDLIKNDDARNKYIMVQQASSHLSYKKLFYNMDLLHQMYPDEDIISISRAGIYGDMGQTLSAIEEKEHKAQAVIWLEEFVKKDYKQPYSHDRILALSQYYYHSGQYLKQYELGFEVVSKGKFGGEVLMAVGGSMHAIELDKQGVYPEAQKYAFEAKKNWEKIYDITNPRIAKAAYQNSFYISSMAILGTCDKAQLHFNQNIALSPKYNEMARWLQQFNPTEIKRCQKQRQLTSQ